MKIFNIKKLSLLSLATFMCACNLDVEPKGQLSSGTFWKTEEDVALALNGCYQYLNGASEEYLTYYDAYADLVVNRANWESPAQTVSQGTVSAATGRLYYTYNGIRRFNFFLDNINQAPVADAVKQKAIAQVKALRAWQYFNLSRQFGPVPYFEKSISKDEEARIAPSSVEDVTQKILADLSFAIEVLKGQNPDIKSTLGEAAVRAIKMRVHLFHKDYQNAAKEAQQIINLNKYSLFSVPDSDVDLTKLRDDDYSQMLSFNSDDAKMKAFYKGLLSYEGIFLQANENNSEVILSREYIKESPNYNGLFLTDGSYYSGWGSITPTMDLLRLYWKQNGETFSSPTDKQRGEYYKQGVKNNNWANFLKEFTDRDTRLYASIIFPQAPWTAAVGKGTLYTWNKGDNDSKTGLIFRKMVDPNYSAKQGEQDMPLIRYAEILLTFAEAQNEVAGPSSAVFDALDLIRQRVSMPNIDRSLNQEQLRKLIRTERAIELAGEGFRWDDIRRWGIEEEVMKNKVTNTVEGDKFLERGWNGQKYLPYPQTALDNNANLKPAQKEKGF